MKNMLKNNKVIPFLWKFIKKYKWLLAIALLFETINNLLTLIGANKTLQKFIDESATGNLTFKKGILYCLVYSLCVCFGMYLNVIFRKIIFPAIFKLKEDIKNFIFQFSLKQSNSFFSENFVGSLNSKINDITTGTERVISNLIDIITSLVSFLAIGAIFMISSWILGSVFIGIFLIYFVVFCWLSKKIEKLSEKTSREESECSGKIIDCFSNILNIKIFSAFKIEKANIRKQTLIILKNKSKVEFLKGCLDFLNATFRLVLIASIFIINLYLLLNKKIEVGEFTANISIITMIFWWLNWSMIRIMELVEVYGKINQAIETLFVNPEIVDFKNTKNLIINKAEINFKNVSFSYKYELPLIFENLNLQIKSYSKIGLVGYSGSGKSSLISLLLRFYDVNSGEILIDNQNIKTEITQESLRKNISYIPQDTILFHRTIKENIVYGKSNATEKEIIEATKKACCYDFVMSLEKGFDTLVGERGVKLSGGQRQRIAIARAILKNSPILILDEATSALDSLTERDIQIALKNLMENKTVIAVAHRLSTLNNMDRIIVLDKGQIIEDGTKDELLNIRGSLFKKMWKMQKDGVIGNEQV